MSKLIMFKAPWCGPCKLMSPIVEQACKDRNIDIIYFDADKDQEEVSKWSVRAVPTMIFIDQDDQEIHRVSGMMTSTEFEVLVDNL